MFHSFRVRRFGFYDVHKKISCLLGHLSGQGVRSTILTLMFLGCAAGLHDFVHFPRGSLLTRFIVSHSTAFQMSGSPLQCGFYCYLNTNLGLHYLALAQSGFDFVLTLVVKLKGWCRDHLVLNTVCQLIIMVQSSCFRNCLALEPQSR